jgi:hypothetical protein
MNAGFKGLEGTRIVPSILTNSRDSTYSQAVEAREWYPEEEEEEEEGGSVRIQAYYRGTQGACGTQPALANALSQCRRLCRRLQAAMRGD